MVALALAPPLGTASAAVTIDFEGFADGTNITGTDLGGVTLTRGGDDVLVTSSVPGADSSRAIQGSPFTGSAYRADFDPLVTAFSVDLGDFAEDEDNLFLNAFDSNNNLLDSDNATLGFGIEALITQAVAGSSISYVEFGSTGNFDNSVFADNLAFTQVPLPGALPLVVSGLGLVVVAARRQRRSGDTSVSRHQV